MNNSSIEIQNSSSFEFNIRLLDDYLGEICFEIYKAYQFNLEKVIVSIGLAFNLINACVFLILILTEKKFKSDMYKYLLLKTLFDAYYLFNVILIKYYDCKGCHLRENSYELYLYWIFSFYLNQVASLMSILTEIAANLDRYIHVSQKLEYLKKIPSGLSLLVMSIFSCLIYVNKFYEREMTKEFNTVHNKTLYRLRYNSFSVTNLTLNIDFMQSTIRDCICVFIILVVNLFTLLSMRKTFKRKRKLNSSFYKSLDKNKKALRKKFNETNRLQSIKVNRAENKITVMVVLTGIVTCVGHGLYFLFNLPVLILQIGFCGYTFTKMVYYVSLGVNLFIYLIFNKSFRTCLVYKIILNCFCFLFFKSRKKKNESNAFVS
jgi:hypothetical protein